MTVFILYDRRAYVPTQIPTQFIYWTLHSRCQMDTCFSWLSYKYLISGQAIYCISNIFICWLKWQLGWAYLRASTDYSGLKKLVWGPWCVERVSGGVIPSIKGNMWMWQKRWKVKVKNFVSDVHSCFVKVFGFCTNYSLVKNSLTHFDVGAALLVFMPSYSDHTV